MSAQSRERSKGFGRTLAFGALAAATLPVFVLAMAPLLGSGRALVLHAILITAGYGMVLASRARQRLAVGAVACLGGLVLAGASSSSGELLVGLSLGVGLIRSGWLLERRTLRAVVVEGLVLIGSVTTAHFLASPGLLGGAVALWGWFVVQSFYFLVGGLRVRSPRRAGDPFDAARRELQELLDQTS